MKQILDELLRIEARCQEGASLLETKAVKKVLESITDACDQLERSWSGSWIGYQSRIYYGDFQTRPAGAVYSIEYGSREARISNPTTGDWREYAYQDVVDEILRRAGKPDQQKVEDIRAKAAEIFETCQGEILATFDAFVANRQDVRIQEARESISKLEPYYTADALARSEAPKTIQTRDRVTLEQKINAPAHVMLRCWVNSIFSTSFALRELAKAARQTHLYLGKLQDMGGKKVLPKTEGKVFIGHGRSPAWRDLKDFLQDRLSLRPVEFNMESAAGKTNVERLEEMLDSACFAFLVMTAEDEHTDSTQHARENVIHEAGLFQGRLGFRKAIILLEEGCAAFSNIDGLGQIRFPKGDIKAKSEEIRQVLEREDLLTTRTRRS